MKFVVLIALAVFALTNAEEWKRKESDEIKAIRAECLKEAPVSDENIKKMMNLEFPDEESVRKYVLCTATKMGTFCEKEGFHPDRIAQQFRVDMDEDEFIKIINDCADKNEQNSSPDVWAFRGHQCIMSGKIGDRVKTYIHEQHKKLQAQKKEE
uniref:Odorant binding protein 13 n=1 Tax=Liriomyza sativae TaxID=127406 RepID=A0A0X8B0P2_LIRSA|nr:odorant binding protein 13 [Liriomyza sativae]